MNVYKLTDEHHAESRDVEARSAEEAVREYAEGFRDYTVERIALWRESLGRRAYVVTVSEAFVVEVEELPAPER